MAGTAGRKQHHLARVCRFGQQMRSFLDAGDPFYPLQAMFVCWRGGLSLCDSILDEISRYAHHCHDAHLANDLRGDFIPGQLLVFAPCNEQNRRVEGVQPCQRPPR